MVMSMDLNNKKTIPLMLRKYHLEKLSSVIDTIDIGLDIQHPMTVDFGCKELFYNWYSSNDGISFLKNNDWTMENDVEPNKFEVVFQVPVPQNKIIEQFMDKFLDMLLEYSNTLKKE